MSLVTTDMRAFLGAHEFVYAVFVDSRNLVETVGDPGLLEQSQLVDELFGERLSDIARLREFLSGQVLPRLWGQGDVLGLIHEPAPGIIVGLFRNDTRGVLEQAAWSKTVDAELTALLSGTI